MHVLHIKRTSYKLKKNATTANGNQYNNRSNYNIVDQYANYGVSIGSIARRMNYSPYLIARYIVLEITIYGNNKKSITNAMKDPCNTLNTLDCILPKYRTSEEFKISFDRIQQPQSTNTKTATTRLAQEVYNVVVTDPMYGPLHDKERHLIGIEYEVVLEHKLTQLGVCDEFIQTNLPI